jgi:hypothetical protein
MANKRDQQIRTVEQTYGKWRAFLVPEHDQASTFQTFYEQEVEPGFKKAKLSRALFDTEKFPSLHDSLPLAGKIRRKSLPIQWNFEALRTSMRTDLERLLLAYIWKRGELWRVEHVLAGLDDDKRKLARESSEEKQEETGEEGPAVMWQFGRHLAKPDAQPIFDQHTSRHRIIFEWLKHEPNLEKLPDANRFNKLTTRDQCHRYLEWWKQNVLPRVERNVASSVESRPNALLWADRIMFSLGKAGAYKTENPTDEAARKPPARRSHGATTKRAVAKRIYCDHLQDTSAQVVKRMINEAKLTEKGARSYYYAFKKAFSEK